MVAHANPAEIANSVNNNTDCERKLKDKRRHCAGVFINSTGKPRHVFRPCMEIVSENLSIGFRELCACYEAHSVLSSGLFSSFYSKSLSKGPLILAEDINSSLNYYDYCQTWSSH